MKNMVAPIKAYIRSRMLLSLKRIAASFDINAL